jgi:hypothetical protein
MQETLSSLGILMGSPYLLFRAHIWNDTRKEHHRTLLVFAFMNCKVSMTLTTGMSASKKWECEAEICTFLNVLFQVSWQLTVTPQPFSHGQCISKRRLTGHRSSKLSILKWGKSVHSKYKGLQRSFCTYDKQQSNKAHFTGQNYRQKYEAETIDVPMSVHREGEFTQSVLQ